MKNFISVRTFVIYPSSEDKAEVNRAYEYLRDAMYMQNRAYNYAASAVYSAIVQRQSSEVINAIYKRAQRNPKAEDPEYSLYPHDDFSFPVGLTVPSTVVQRLRSDMKTACKKGLLKGNVSLQNRKRTAALLVESRFLSFYHGYESDEEFLAHLYDNELKVYLKFVNGIHFKVVLGLPHKSHELRSVLGKVFSGEYKVCQSNIVIDNEGKILLNLSLKIPAQTVVLDENTVVGVDLGIAVPACCALNNDVYKRKFIGSADDFLRIRTRMQAQRKRLTKSLASGSGGHGRGKKLRALNRLKEVEANFVATYNHMVSKRVVDFALKNHAKYINLEDLSAFGKKTKDDEKNKKKPKHQRETIDVVEDSKKYILRNWSYYQLQQDIAYKAARFGIEVRKVEPAYTSQTCSYCGSVDKEQRLSQAKFVCKNPNCESHKHCGDGHDYINADFNAARNIAMSTKWAKTSEEKQEEEKQRKSGKHSKKMLDNAA